MERIIVIKGMEMPESCIECACFSEEACYCKVTGGNLKSSDIFVQRASFCPLIKATTEDPIAFKDGKKV